jgi:hypothetical protein
MRSKSAQKQELGAIGVIKILVFVLIYGKIAVGKNFLDHSIGSFVKLSQLRGKNMLFNRLNGNLG